MKKVLKIVGIILLILVLLIAAVVGALLYKNHRDSLRAWLPENYYTLPQPELPLEGKYTGAGSYAVSHAVISYGDKTIQNVRVWYPADMETAARTWPVVFIVNASNMAALNYEPYFARLASWGFIVVGNDDRQTGTGVTTKATLDFMLALNADESSVFCGKLDETRIGIAGYSQGGAGAIRAVTEYVGGAFRALFTGSAAHSYLAQMWGGYDAAKVDIPWFMVAGTGNSDDTGLTDPAAEWTGVAPLFSLEENYAKATGEPKVRARAAGAEHEEMQIRSDGYMTAFMLWQLCGDEEAAGVFAGEDAEILRNANWQDVEKSM